MITRIASAAVLAADDKPQDELQRARVALDRGEYGEAIKLTSALIERDAKSFPGHFYRALANEGAKDYAAAVADFTMLIELDSKQALSRNVRADDRRGDVYLKLGEMDKAIADFDAFIKREPDVEPFHWRRGIAFYYAGQYQRGIDQFELHKTVNGSDVENSVWHFMCNAKLHDVETARKALIPLEGNDGRVPMMKVFDMFAGKATPEDVMKAAQAAGGERQSESALFYGHLYLGLYYEALGKTDLAKEHMVLAAVKHTSPYYMGDVARVHAKLRKWGDKNGK